MIVPFPFRADDQHLYYDIYTENKETWPPLLPFVLFHRYLESIVLVPCLIQIRNDMGQTSSVIVGDRPNEPHPPTTEPKSSTSPDPFHRSPISVRPIQAVKPRLDPRPSLISLRKYTSSPPGSDENLPKPTLGERVVRKISKSRKTSIPHISSLPPLPPKPVRETEHLVDIIDGVSRYPLHPTSLDSSTISGPSTSLVTPSASRRNLTSSIIPPFTPIHQIKRPIYLREGSSTSSTELVPAPIVARSPKTRSKAEKEWRAKVAAISASAKTKDGSQRRIGSGGESPAYKGPVPPPRRRPGPQGQTGVTIIPVLPIPPSYAISGNTGSLPPHLVIKDKSSPGGRSFTSTKSFETLGHHPSLARSASTAATGSPSHTRVHIRTMSASPSSPLSHHRPHSRKASIPRSVSSFYADPDLGGTRPHSLAAATFLSPTRAEKLVEEGPEKIKGTSAEVAVMSEDGEMGSRISGVWKVYGDEDEEEDEATFDLNLNFGSIPHTPIKTHTVPLPSSTTLPARPITPLPRTPASTADLHTPTPSKNPYRNPTSHSSTPPIAYGPETPRSQARKERILSLPAIHTSPKRTPPQPKSSDLQVVLGLDTPSPSVPSLMSNDLSTPTPTRSHDVSLSTPNRPGGDSATPTTPYSPMTAYILSAENIDLTFPMTSPAAGWSDARRVSEIRGKKEDRGEGYLHPFASVLDAPSPARIKEINTAESFRESKEEGETERKTGLEFSRRPLPRPREDKPLGVTSTISTGHTHRRQPPPIPPQHPLRSKTPNGPSNSRIAILGSMAKQERSRGKVELDLCPGMAVGGGVRPPKRGMDVSDLEKWLAGTK